MANDLTPPASHVEARAPSSNWRSIEVLTLRFGARIRRVALWTAGLLVAFAILGFLLLPHFLKPALERELSADLDRNVSIGRLDINPFAISATLHDVSISGRGGQGSPLLTLTELYVNGQIASLFRWAPVINALTLMQPVLNVVRNEDKTYNFSDLLDRAVARPPGPPPRFSISNIEVIDGRITFDDRPEHRQHQVTELNIGIPFLSSLPTQTEIKVEPRFSAMVNGRPVAVSGETRPFADTHETVLHWDLGDLPLPTYIEYVPVALPVKIESGQLGGKLDLSFVGRGSDPPQLTLAGAFRLADLALSEHSSARMLRVPLLTLDIDRIDVFGNSVDLRSIVADGIELELRRAASGEINLATLTPSRAAAGEKPFRFRVGSIAVKHGAVRITDATVTPPFTSTLSDVTAGITNLTSGATQKANFTLSFATDTGAHASHRGTINLSPFHADGRLEVSGWRLAQLYPYYASALNLVVDDGAMDGTTDIQIDSAGALALTSLDVTASNVKMRLPDEKEPLWRIPTLAAHGGSIDVSKRAISFDSVESHSATTTVRRRPNGAINFDRVMRTSELVATPSPSAEPWRFEARKIALDDFAATFVDETVTPPARIALSRISLDAENLFNPTKAKGHATLKATVNKRGTLSLAGPVATAPFAATLNVVAKDIDLVPFQAYLSQSARVILTGGAASVRGTSDIAVGTPTRATYKGNLTLSDVTALDEANETDLLKWKTLTLANVDAQLEPLAVSVGDITLDNLFARLLLNENGEFNLQQLGRDRAPATAPPTPTAEPNTVQVSTPPGKATTWLRLGKATLTGGNIDFTDHFIRPNYSANLTDVSGSLSSLAFDKPADLDLKGNVQGSAPVEISGRINPLSQNLFLDVKASATDIELPPLSPYSGKYVGYGIEKGKLSMKVRYLIENRKLTAENGIVLDQLTFGARVESPDAIKVPVLLAVALLKDRNGVIRFDLPVGGSLDDPKFSVGRIVFQALVNLLLKIVTSPFALLGSLGGHHGEELAYIEFASGSATLDAEGEKKIDAIAKAMIDRPAVKLEIAGRSEPAVDEEGLKRAVLDRKIRLQKFNDLKSAGQPPPSVDAVEVPASEYESLLVRVYRAEDFSKPRNAIGFPKDLSKAEMESLIFTNTKVSAEDLRLLAEHRAQIVHDRLTGAGDHVPAERVFVVAPRLNAEGIKDKGKPTRVDFSLR
jgi:hypothetical protein